MGMSTQPEGPEEEVSTAATLAGTQPASAPTGPSAAPVVGPQPEFPVPNWERYEFILLLGRGGMGAVYKARDRRLGRIVALKFIHTEDPAMAQRFQQEARAQASIDHPLICKVYEVGEVGGKAYIAMQYVAGQSLEQAAARLSLSQKVQVIRDVAEALHEAHRQGIVHRDVKPANIMVEVGADGRLRPIVMDFGIARETGVNTGLTEAGAVLGTPAYMAPEQARGDVSEISRRTDVYSLGATLYELLTGKPPFSATSLLVMLVMVSRDDPTPPRQLVPSLPVDLETITLKCLRKEPPQRYDSAKALAEDLQRYINGDPILARKSSLRYRIEKGLRKNKTLVAISCASLLGISVLAVDGVRSRLASARQERVAREQASRARQLGQDVKEIEWFMRAVYELPLHDTSYEQGLIRTRMQRLERQLGDLGTEGGSLAHYALGRGYLALQEPQHAYDHLMDSWNSGNRSPELHYAIGRVLSQRYDDTLRAEQRKGDRKWREERRQALEKELLPEALLHLEQSRSVELESASYLEGLIAFYKRQFDDALRHANRALQQSPWLYEAMKLKADVLYERWLTQYRKGEGVPAETDLREALNLYDQAAALGRSDVTVYEARADAWYFFLLQRYDRGLPLAEHLPAALSACSDTIAAAPRRSAGYQLGTSIHLLVAQQQLDTGGDPRPQIQKLRTLAEAAIKQNAANEFLYNALGSGLVLVLFHEEANRLPYSVSITEAIKYLHHSIELRPGFPWAYNDLAGAYLFRARDKLENLENPTPDLQEALCNTEQASKLDPDYITPYSNSAYFRYMIADYLREHGNDPRAELAAGMRSGEDCVAHRPSLSDCYSNLALLSLTAARYYASTQQPEPFLAALTRTLSSLQAAEERGDKSLEHEQSVLAAQVLSAQQKVRSGQDAAAEKARAQTALAACRALSAKDSLCTILAAELALLDAETAAQPTTRAEALAQALVAAEQAVAENPRSAPGHRVLAAVRLARARLQLAGRRRAAAAAEVTAGGAALARALALNPDSPSAKELRAALAALPELGLTKDGKAEKEQ
jgi:serine/threonine-protein kinase